MKYVINVAGVFYSSCWRLFVALIVLIVNFTV